MLKHPLWLVIVHKNASIHKLNMYPTLDISPYGCVCVVRVFKEYGNDMLYLIFPTKLHQSFTGYHYILFIQNKCLRV